MRFERGYGEIGRHARFRFWCRKAWEFKSLYPHQNRRACGPHEVPGGLKRSETAVGHFEVPVECSLKQTAVWAPPPR